MPRKRATRVKNHAKPKKPQDDIGNDLDPEERRQKLEMFLMDFDMEVKQRIQKIERKKIELQSLIEKELNMQLSYLPMEIRNMNCMDFVAAGGTMEAAMLSLENSRKDTLAKAETTDGVCFTSKKGRGQRKAKGTAGGKTDMAPPSSTLTVTHKNRSRFQTPASRKLPAVWDTPAVTPKFDINLPFTPGLARAPKHGERLMSLAGSPVDITTQKVSRTLKHTQAPICEEEEVESAVSRLVAAAPHIPENAIHKFLSEFAKTQDSS